MDLVEQTLLVVHLLGFGALFGSLAAQVTSTTRTVTRPMLYGAVVAVLAGIGLVGVLEGGDDPVDHTKVAVKFAVGLVVVVLLWVNRRGRSVPPGLFFGLLGLTVLNVGVAVYW